MFGEHVRDLGDIDGDGLHDCVLSEPDEWFDGVLHAFSGKDGHAIWTSAPPSEIDVPRLGESLEVVGDVDGDGIVDFVAGTCGSDTAAPGCAVLFSGKKGKPLLEIRHGKKGLEVHKPDPSLSWSAPR
jgi:hypothetical protein